MTPATILFLIAALVTAAVSILIVRRMATQLHQVAPGERRGSILLDLPKIIHEHNRRFPRSEPMLAFWLTIIFLLVWLSCLAVSLATHL